MTLIRAVSVLCWDLKTGFKCFLELVGVQVGF